MPDSRIHRPAPAEWAVVRRDSAVGVPDSAVRAPGRMGWAAAGRTDCFGPPNVTWPQRSGPRGKRTRLCGPNFPTASRPWYGPHLPHPQAHATSAPWPHVASAPCQSPEVAQSNARQRNAVATESPTGLLRNRAALNSHRTAHVTASQRPLQKPSPPKPHAKPPTTNHGHTPPQRVTAPNLRKESPHRITTANRAPNHAVKTHGESPQRRPTAEGHEATPATPTRSARHPHPQPPPAHERRPRFAPGEGGSGAFVSSCCGLVGGERRVGRVRRTRVANAGRVRRGGAPIRERREGPLDPCRRRYGRSCGGVRIRPGQAMIRSARKVRP